LDKNVHTIKTNTDALTVASKECGLEHNEKSQNVVMSHEQDAAQTHHIQIAKYFEMW
jgi:hypothetical protein